MMMLTAGKADVVLCWHTDRLAPPAAAQRHSGQITSAASAGKSVVAGMALPQATVQYAVPAW